MSQSTSQYRSGQRLALLALRMLVGWHLLYEGIAKLGNAYWTSAGFLSQAQGPFAGWFLWLVSEPSRLQLVDLLNKWGLTLIGLSLVVGLGTRTASLLGIILLALYYLANPPLPGLETTIPAEGSYVIVNKILIEIAALMVIRAFPTDDVVGLGRLLRREGESG